MASVRTGLMWLAVLTFSVSLAGQAAAPAEQFSFIAPQAPKSMVDPERFRLTIQRWSTDAERDAISARLAESGAETLLDAVRDAGIIGHVRWPGGLEYSVRYARRWPRASGTDVVLVLDRPLWHWWQQPATAPTGAFSVVQLRLDASGKGEGRVGTPAQIVADKAAGVALSDFAAQPALFTDLRRETSGPRAS